ncbi:hypothetical protein [Microbacterium sp. P04]|uniref:hypothetical protein n=1 Tax=Microbacterium sp. P04 TaxID=3366947 RepID=UPI003745E37F
MSPPRRHASDAAGMSSRRDDVDSAGVGLELGAGIRFEILPREADAAARPRLVA